MGIFPNDACTGNNITVHGMFSLPPRFILTVVFVISTSRFSNGDVICYDCGYLQDAEGKQGPIVEVETAVNYCNGTDEDADEFSFKGFKCDAPGEYVCTEEILSFN